MERRVHPSPWLTPGNADYSKFLISVEYMGAIDRSLFETVRKHNFLGVHEVTLDLGRLLTGSWTSAIIKQPVLHQVSGGNFNIRM